MARQSNEGGSSHLLLGLGLGALAMYYADPQNGERRRALARAKCDEVTGKVKRGTEIALRDAAHRTSGFLVTARNRIEKTPADDVVIAERIRSALGRCASYPRAIEVEVNQGRAVLKLSKRIAYYHTALVQVMKDLPLIYLYSPINRFGVAKNVGGVVIFGDGLIRAQYAGFKK